MSGMNEGESALQIDTGTHELLCNLRERVLTITFNRPASRNALSSLLSPALRRLLRETADDARVGAVVLTGAGDAFCAGGDVKGMAQNNAAASGPPATAAERVADLQRRQRELSGALLALRQPTIAALPGPAVGAGLAIALACDLRIAAETAFMTTGYVRVGLSGDYGISWLLTRAVGTARARELLFTNARIDARRAEALGLVNQVVSTSDLQAAAFVLARELANGPQDALWAMKSNLDDAQGTDFFRLSMLKQSGSWRVLWAATTRKRYAHSSRRGGRSFHIGRTRADCRRHLLEDSCGYCLLVR